MKQISDILTVPVTLIFWALFGLIMVIFDIFQRMGHLISGYQGLKRMVEVQNGLLLLVMRLHGVKVVFNQREEVHPQPHLFVANHQSMFDIPPMIWHLRRFHPKFIAKKELTRTVPGISYNLKHGGSLAIDRSSRSAALEALRLYPSKLKEFGWTAVLYPEGTRSASPKMKPWKRGGLAAMLNGHPDLCVVPIRIDNSWRMSVANGWRIPFGVTITFTLHKATRMADDEDVAQFIDRLEAIVGQPQVADA